MGSTPPPPYSQSADYGHIKIPFDIQAASFPPPPQFANHAGASPPSHSPSAMPPPIVVHRIVQARTALYGPFPVEIDCPYCNVSLIYLKLIKITYGSKIKGTVKN